MPTSATMPLFNGTATSLNDFALKCARELGMFAENVDNLTPRPTEFNSKSSGNDEAAQLQQTIEAVKAWTKEEADQYAQEHYQTALKQFEADVAEVDERRKRYETMRLEVEAWEPPTGEHNALKRLMFERIEKDLRLECSPPVVPTCLSGEMYRRQRLAELMRYLDVVNKARDTQDTFNRKRTAWTQALRDSLPESPQIIGI